MNNKAVKAVSVLIVLVLLLGCFLFVKHFTGNFKETFALFYVREGKQDILHQSVGNSFNRKYNFDVKYTFGLLNKDKTWYYKLQCTSDFTYSVDGVEHNFSELDLDELFDVQKTTDGLSIDFSKNVYTLLAQAHNVERNAILIDAESIESVNVVTLSFYSADGEHVVRISGLFGGLDKLVHITVSPTEVLF